MNPECNINRWYVRLLCFTVLSLTCFAACKKAEEPARLVGNELPYVNSQKELSDIIDSIPEASLFKLAFKRSTIQAYMDSLNAGSTDVPYTLFVPTNDAFTSAGYTADKLNTAPVGELNKVLGYLILPGRVSDKLFTSLTETTQFPLVHPDPKMARTTSRVFNKTAPYFYALSVGFTANTLLLNGQNVKNNAVMIKASNGALLMIDQLIKCPEIELYQALVTDTTLSFYLAAMRKSNQVYKKKGIIGNSSFNIMYNDTTWLQLTNSPTYQGAGSLPFAIVLAPVNDAFRKAGFTSVAAINSYIDKSVLLTNPNYTSMLTNMDSILVNHRLLSGFAKVNGGRNYLFISDMKNTSGFSNGDNLGAVFFKENNGSVLIHRQDFPEGPATSIVQTSDINTLNGVLHKVDKLLLPK